MKTDIFLEIKHQDCGTMAGIKIKPQIFEFPKIKIKDYFCLSSIIFHFFSTKKYNNGIKFVLLMYMNASHTNYNNIFQE